MELAVVIPTFNRFLTTKECIDSLRGDKSRNDLIVICDSSSTDGTQTIQSYYENLIFIDVGPGAWWSAAVNAGVQKAIQLGYRSVLVLNDDLTFNANLIETILAASKKYPRTIISAAQQNNSKIYLGSIYSGLFKKTHHIYNDLKFDKKLSLEVQTTNGSCLLIPCEVFETIGYFDEIRCPHLYGDTEFQLRALRANIKIICDLTINVIQQANTDYIKKISFASIFVAPGSPFKISAYWAFCKVLFGSDIKALFLGIWHHFYFIKQIIKVCILKCYYYLNNSRLLEQSYKK
jgi:GT2 family glycosyltransferase